MSPDFNLKSVKSFTLIELIIVIAILGILAAAVVIVLDPAETLAQSRDAQRFSDLDTMNKSISLYQVANGGSLPGNANTVYVSIADTSSTCGDLGLPTLPSGDSYACSSNPQAVNGTGWIPINLAANNGNTLSSLPVDPSNTTSTGLYYTYSVSGNYFELTAVLESQKYRSQEEAHPAVQLFPGLFAEGTSLSISPLFNTSGLVGYWNLDEGTGTTAYDLSGNSNNGTWQTGSTYVSGKLGSYAGWFSDSSTSYIAVNVTSSLEPANVTLTEWEQEPTTTITTGYTVTGIPLDGGYTMIVDNNQNVDWSVETSGTTRYEALYHGVTAGTWYFLAGTFNGTNVDLYLNGNLVASTTGTLGYSSPSFYLGREESSANEPYELDDVRTYSRALSSAEIQALYNTQH